MDKSMNTSNTLTQDQWLNFAEQWMENARKEPDSRKKQYWLIRASACVLASKTAPKTNFDWLTSKV